MFPEKFTVYAVVSIPGMPGLDPMDKFRPKLEGYYPTELSAETEANRLKTWKATAVVAQELSSSDLIRVLNRIIEDQA